MEAVGSRVTPHIKISIANPMITEKRKKGMKTLQRGFNYVYRMTPEMNGVDHGTEKDVLVLVLHGLRGSALRMEHVVSAILENDDTIQVISPTLPHSQIFSCKDPVTIVKNLREDVDRIWNNGKYTLVKIVGHSTGCLFARALMNEGRRFMRSPSFQSPGNARRYWADTRNTDRAVLLAGVNRGLGISRHMNYLTLFKSVVAHSIGRLIQFFTFKTPLAFRLYRGAPFVTNLRLNWLVEDNKNSMPLTIQLLGTVDDMVGPNDSLDMVTGGKFHYLDVPDSGHVQILDMENSIDPSSTSRVRREIFKIAFRGTSTNIKKREVRPWELHSSVADFEKRNKVNHVVFIIHGIRDQGHWTDKIARAIWVEAGRPDGTLEKVVDSYGFFGMGQFLLPNVRWKKVTWFMEKYLEAKSRYPNAKFSFVGHSHGTYLLAKALEEFPECKFQNVVFAGSVVREGYNWQEKMETDGNTKTGRVARVLNITATSDWVVAWFPRIFNQYNIQELGGAGHNGFDQTNGDTIRSVKYAVGGHEAGIRETLWSSIARFVLSSGNDKIDLKLPESVISPDRSYIVKAISWINIVIWIILAQIIIFGVPALIVNIWNWEVTQGFMYASGEYLSTMPGALVPALIGLFLLVHIGRSQLKYDRPNPWFRWGILPIALITGWYVVDLVKVKLRQLFDCLENMVCEFGSFDSTLTTVTTEPAGVGSWLAGGIVLWFVFVSFLFKKI